MENKNSSFWGRTRYWWVVSCLGILTMLCGFAYWFFPFAGFAVASQLFGWLMIVAGIVQLCVSAGNDRPRGWGWWLVGGVIDMFIGFMLVRSVILSEMVFPYFIAFVMIFWGLSAIFSAISQVRRKYWWLYLINGILLVLVGYFVAEAGYLQEVYLTSFIVSVAFIYWGICMAVLSYDMRPAEREQK